MSYNAETYTVISNRLSDWLRVTGGKVSNLPLDLLNRGQNKIQGEKPWSKLMFNIELEQVEDETNTYLLPDEMITYKLLGYDTDEDGKMDGYFYRHARRSQGFEIEDRFDKAAGHKYYVRFYVAPFNTPIVRYQKQLTDFTGEDTEYSYFPGEFLLRAAQLVHIEETGLKPSDVQIIKNSYNDELKKYESNHHMVNNDLRMEMLDNAGTPISTESTSLQGDFSGSDLYRGLPNSADLR